MSTCFKIACFVAYRQTIPRGETYHHVLCYTERGIFSNWPMILLKRWSCPLFTCEWIIPSRSNRHLRVHWLSKYSDKWTLTKEARWLTDIALTAACQQLQSLSHSALPRCLSLDLEVSQKTQWFSIFTFHNTSQLQLTAAPLSVQVVAVAFAVRIYLIQGFGWSQQLYFR